MRKILYIALGLLFLPVFALGNEVKAISEDNISNDSIPSDSISRKLDEVEVVADRVRQYSDRDELFLSEQNRRFGTSAIDAISSMPEFQTVVNGTSITTNLGQKVTLLINGKKATYEELSAYPVEYIKKVVYYSIPPSKYVIYGNDPLIDVIMKRSLLGFHSVRYSGDLSSSFSTNHNGSYMFADSLTTFRVWLNSGVAASTGIKITDITHIKDLTQKETGTSGHSSNQVLHPGLSYQRLIGKSLWNISGDFEYYHRDFEYNQKGIYSHADLQATGLNKTRRKSYGPGGNVNLYYEYRWDDVRRLMLNVVNTLYHTNSLSNSSWQSESTVFPSYLYPNPYRNNTYSLICEASYSNPLFGGVVTPGVRYMYKNLHRFNKFNSVESNIHTNQYEADIAYSRQFGSVFYGNAAIKTYVFENIKPDGSRLTQLTPDYNLSLIFTPSRYLKLYFGSVARNIAPSVNDLAGTKTIVSDNFVRLGNTNLKSCHIFDFNLTFRQESPSQKFYSAGTVSLNYTPDAWSSCVYFIDDYVIAEQTRHLGPRYIYKANFSCGWSPVEFFAFTPFIEWKHYKLKTLFKDVSAGSPSFTLKFNFYMRSAYAMISLYSTGRSYGGDGYYRSSPGATVLFMWNHKKFSYTLRYSYERQGLSFTRSIPGYSYVNSLSHALERNYVIFNIVYQFNKGRKPKIEQKGLDNSDSDRGA